MKIQILKPFGPSIVKLKIPDEIVNAMNDYTDKIIIDKQKLENLDHGAGLAGNVHQEFLLDINFMKKIDWANFLAKVCSQWVKHHNGRELKDFKIIKSWIVRQFKNEYNPIHWHDGHISGAGFLKLPKTFGSHFQKKEGKDYRPFELLNLGKYQREHFIFDGKDERDEIKKKRKQKHQNVVVQLIHPIQIFNLNQVEEDLEKVLFMPVWYLQ